MYLPSIVMVSLYFDRRRALATGIAVCGSGLGAFVFAPFFDRLLAVYVWQDVMIVVSAIVMQGVVMGALFRPLTARAEPTNIRQRHQATNDGTDSADERRHSAESGAYRRADEIVIRIECSTRLSIDGYVNEGCVTADPEELSRESRESWVQTVGPNSPKVRFLQSDVLQHGTARSVDADFRTRFPVKQLNVLNTQKINIIPYRIATNSPADERSADTPSRVGVCCEYLRHAVITTVDSLFDRTLLKDVVFILYTSASSLCLIGKSLTRSPRPTRTHALYTHARSHARAHMYITHTHK